MRFVDDFELRLIFKRQCTTLFLKRETKITGQNHPAILKHVSNVDVKWRFTWDLFESRVPSTIVEFNQHIRFAAVEEEGREERCPHSREGSTVDRPHKAEEASCCCRSFLG